MDTKNITPLLINTTLIPPLNESQEAQTSIYHIIMPIFAIICIIINISVVFSSGLILKKSRFFTALGTKSKPILRRSAAKDYLSFPWQCILDRHHNQRCYIDRNLCSKSFKNSQCVRFSNWFNCSKHFGVSFFRNINRN